MAKVEPKAAPNPKTPSSDYREMAEYWRMVGALLHGVEALRQTTMGSAQAAVAGPVVPYASLRQLDARRRGRSAAVSPYLPQFPNEQNTDYETRRKSAPLTNIYKDVSFNLASKPFSKTLTLDEKTGDDLKKLAMNIDGQGNNLHVFASQSFKSGIDKGISWILVDYDKVKTPLTLADERAMGARPYWVHIPPERLLAVYSDFLNGQEVFVHARIYEVSTSRDGFDESVTESVRIFNRDPIVDANDNVIDYQAATWEVHELQENQDPTAKEKVQWVKVDEGNITIGIIPLIPFRTGERDGLSWKVTPPLKDLAHMQIEEFQQESNLKRIKELTAFPMLTGNGVPAPVDKDGNNTVVPVGPGVVLFAPPQMDGRGVGRWEFIEPGAQSLKFLEDSLTKHRDEMRDLGMQPLATANLTVITTANVSMKAHNAVQAWALGLKDALEQAWIITCRWLNQATIKPVVKIHTDFGVDFEAGTELTALQAARAAKDLSQKTFWSELQRRGTLSDDFDADAETEELAKEQTNRDLQPEKLIDPVTGKPLLTQRVLGDPNPPPKPPPPKRPTVN